MFLCTCVRLYRVSLCTPRVLFWATIDKYSTIENTLPKKAFSLVLHSIHYIWYYSETCRKFPIWCLQHTRGSIYHLFITYFLIYPTFLKLFALRQDVRNIKNNLFEHLMELTLPQLVNQVISAKRPDKVYSHMKCTSSKSLTGLCAVCILYCMCPTGALAVQAGAQLNGQLTCPITSLRLDVVESAVMTPI